MADTYVYQSTYGDIEVNFTSQLLNCEDTITNLEVQEVVNACREAEDSEIGIVYPKICNASGKDYLSVTNGVQVGITLVLLDEWRVYTRKATGVFTVLGGNLVQVSGGNPFAPNPLVTEVNILSAASTIVSVSSGSGLSTEEHNRLMSIPTETLTDEQAQALSETLSEERAKGLLFERENTIIEGQITEYTAGGDITVAVTYDNDGIPVSEAIQP